MRVSLMKARPTPPFTSMTTTLAVLEIEPEPSTVPEPPYGAEADAPVAIFLHGLSDAWPDVEQPPSGHRLLGLADDVVAFMNAVGIERAAIVGQSMGSLVAQTFAAKYPDRVARLVLIGSATSVDARAKLEFAEALRTLDEVPYDLPFGMPACLAAIEAPTLIVWDAEDEHRPHMTREIAAFLRPRAFRMRR